MILGLYQTVLTNLGFGEPLARVELSRFYCQILQPIPPYVQTQNYQKIIRQCLKGQKLPSEYPAGFMIKHDNDCTMTKSFVEITACVLKVHGILTASNTIDSGKAASEFKTLYSQVGIDATKACANVNPPKAEEMAYYYLRCIGEYLVSIAYMNE